MDPDSLPDSDEGIGSTSESMEFGPGCVNVVAGAFLTGVRPPWYPYPAMMAHSPSCRPEVESVVAPTPGQLGEIRELFLEYPHKNYQLRVLGIDKENMADYLQDGLVCSGSSRLVLGREGSRLRGLACLAPSRLLSERLRTSMWCLRHLVATGDNVREMVRALADACEPGPDSGAEVVTARVACSDQAAVRALEDTGFRLVAGEVVGVVRFEDPDPVVPEGLKVVPMWARHVDQVTAIACSVHRYNRFAFDPRFDRETVDELYRLVVARYAEDESTETLVVVDDQEAVLGFIAFKLNHGLERFTGRRHGSLDFVGVRADAQSRGLGDILNRCALSTLRQQGTDTVMVQTLMNNYNALAILRKIGFRITSSNMVLHRWFT